MGGDGAAPAVTRARRASRPRATRTLGVWAKWSLLLTSPFLLMVIMHAKARRVVVRATLSVLLPLLRAAARALGVLPSADADPNARVVEDPDLPVWLAGVSSLVAAERRAKKSLWEWWLDALHFSPDSPGRAHIRQLLSHPETARKLEALFDALDTQCEGKLDKDALVRFSAGIRGTVRVLLNRERARVADGAGPARASPRDGAASIELEPATARESQFLVDNFDLLFPDEHPLDLAAFLSMAKLVLVRRIVKALVKRHGLQTVRAGMRAPVVVDLSVVDDANGSRCLFRVHTVAPSTAPGVDGHRLGAIAESPGVSASGGGGVTKTRNAAKQTSTRRREKSGGKTSDAFDPGAPLRMSDVWAEVRAIEAGETAGSSDEDTEEASWSDYS